MSTNPTHSPLGIVVEHKDTKIRYAVKPENFREGVHRKIRDLKPGESPRTYQPRQAGKVVETKPAEAKPTTPHEQPTK